LTLNGLDWVITRALAFSNRRGRAEFHVPLADSALASFAHRDDHTRSLEVEVDRLDDYTRENHLSGVHFLKVDVEGAELEVFQGAPRLLAGHEAPLVMFEAVEAHAQRLGYSVSAVKRLLEDYGYTCYGFRHGVMANITADDNDHDDLLGLKPMHVDRHPELRSLLR
jgi:FkbM family methyltransferase